MYIVTGLVLSALAYFVTARCVGSVGIIMLCAVLESKKNLRQPTDEPGAVAIKINPDLSVDSITFLLFFRQNPLFHTIPTRSIFPGAPAPT